MRKYFLFFITVFIFCLQYGQQSIAFDGTKLQDSITKKEEVFLEADQMDYDQNNGIVRAYGNVEVQKGINVLFADNITYDQKQNIVLAYGNVSYVGPDGNVVFTDQFVLKDDLKSGIINYFRAKLDDGSLIAAAQARRVNETKTELSKAVYSPCPICTTDPNSDPQWQIKAEKVTIDNAEQKVTYDDAYLEAYGIPVAYTPYFSHLTPNADRKSGLLVPKFRTDSNLGAAITIPYYWNIAPDMEAKLQPVITSKEGLVAASSFKHLTKYGEYELFGSITRPRGFSELASKEDNDKEIRGHLKGKGLFNLTETWDTGFDAQFTSDDTYLRRYNYDNLDLTTSRAFLERIKDRDYTNIQTVHFRGLLEQDNNDTTPFVLPYAKSHIESNLGIIPNYPKSKLTFDIAGFSASRNLGQDNQRISAKANLIVPHITSSGHIFELTASIRDDQHYLQNSTNDGGHNRLIPEASINWSLPMSKITNHGTYLIEPIAKIVASPNTDYNKKIPNEDSQDVEFSELNVFENNRYRGLDHLESGIRTNYGLRGGFYADDYSINYVVGQSYRFNKTNNVPINSGIEGNWSDIVGRVGASLSDNKVDFAYRFRLDQKTLNPRRHEFDLGINLYPVKVNLGYFNLDYDFTNNPDNREEISGNAKINLTKEWSVIAGGTRNLANKSNVVSKLGALYEGECTTISAILRKGYIDDRDAKSGTSFDLNIGLKNLGNF